MENKAQLIWVKLQTVRDEREKRTIELLAHLKPRVIEAGEDPEELVFGESVVVVLSALVIDAGVEHRIRRIASRAPRARMLVRTRVGEARPEWLRQFGPAGILDADEGPDLTKARVLVAMATDGQALRVADPVPEWRARLVGQSHAIQKVAEVIRLVGPRRCTVLITGETGTGKEIAARAVHMAGPRASGPFVALNCSAVPAALIEAELFGHTRGAFTGATQVRAGRFEQAHGGTLFLDEIGDLPLELQAKILRVLQEREFQKLGSSETVRVDARVVAATNCDLRLKVAEGSFREDLYYRLNVVPLELPPLRARRQDIRPLTEHFIVKVCRDENMPSKRLTPDAWAALEQYDWPGNVRQLENAIASAVILSEDRLYLDADDFTLPPVSGTMGDDRDVSGVELPDTGLDFTRTINALERSLLAQALHRTGGNKKAAAEILRLKRTTLSAKVRVLEMQGAA